MLTGKEALKGVSLDIEEGEIIALLAKWRWQDDPDLDGLRYHLCQQRQRVGSWV